MQINKILLISAILFTGLTAHSQECTPPCPKTVLVQHTKGMVSPKTVKIIYTTKAIGNKCWITRNLGATADATSSTDAAQASIGWVFHYGEAQGFYYDVAQNKITAPLPYPDVYSSKYDGWPIENDPCAISLGSGWHIPTSAEYLAAVPLNTTLANGYTKLKLRKTVYANGTTYTLSHVIVYLSDIKDDKLQHVWGDVTLYISTVPKGHPIMTGLRCVKNI